MIGAWCGVGRLLDGRYRLEHRIASGSTATVYRARQANLGRWVAVKVLHPRFSADALAVKRFENEARIVAQLRHPNTVKLIDFGRTADRQYYLVTELVDGQPLSEIILRGPLEVRRLLGLLEQIVGSLEEAHLLGIIHRDLKPANIMVERVGGEEIAKVLDFGLAVFSSVRKPAEDGELVGSPAYMAPEQAECRSIDARSDLYSLGVIAFECLTGARPFDADSQAGLLMKHILAEPPSVRSLVPELPEEVESLVTSMMIKDPERRVASSQALRQTIDSVSQLLDGLDAIDRSTAATRIFGPAIRAMRVAALSFALGA